MIKKIIFLFLLMLIPFSINAQIRITEKKVEEVISQFEEEPIKIIKVKTLRKWKALKLSSDMKAQMDYNVVRVKYKTAGVVKIILIDRNLVPIRYDYLMLAEK